MIAGRIGWRSLVLGGLALGPPALERAARDLAPAERVDVELGGIVLEDLAVARGPVRARVDRAILGADWHGGRVELFGVELEATAPEPPRLRSAPASSPPAPTPGAPPPAPGGPPRLDLGGLPVTVMVHGPVALAQGDTRVRLHETTVRVDTHGRLSAELELDLRHGTSWGSSIGPVRARPLDGWSRWRVEGVAHLLEGPPVAFVAEVSPDGGTVRVRSEGSGRLDLSIERGATTRARLHAEGFALAPLAPAVSTLRPDVEVGSSRISGAAELTWGDTQRLSLDDFEVDGLTVRHPKLAAEPVVLGALSLTGDLWRDGDRHWGSDLWLSHGHIATHLAAGRSGERLSLEAVLAPLPCQAFFDSLPAGLVGPLAEMRFGGDIDGRLALALDLAAVGTGEEEGPPPGEVAFDFPFLERCTVRSDAPLLDLEGLRAAYEHRFIDGRGRARTRHLTRGAAGFVPVGRVPRLAAAFVTLEDTRFWHHDGFDRLQIERALWHNLRVGQVSRGASTITQQAARNLFLGIDRSAARKLQEALLAARLEANLSKRRLLEIYLNVIELGPGIHGVEEGAQFHFGKPATELGVLQALHLAAMAPAPAAYSRRFASGEVDEAWMDDLRRHVRRLHLHGYIDRAEMLAALRDDLDLRPRAGG